MAIDLLPDNPYNLLKRLFRGMFLKINEIIGVVNSPMAAQLPIDYLTGFNLFNSASPSRVTASAGTCRDSTDTADIIQATLRTFDTDGSGVNGIDTGVKANDTLYAVYSIWRISDSQADTVISLDMATPLLPATYDLFRRIGVIRTNNIGNVNQFFQTGNGRDRWHRYFAENSTLALESNGTDVVFTSTGISVADFVPIVATEIELSVTAEKLGTSSLTSRAMVNIEGQTDVERWVVESGVDSSEDIKVNKTIVMPFVAGQELQYKILPSGDCQCDIYISGYLDSL